MAPTYLAVDDTDSLDGMCTTYLATQLIAAIDEFDLIGLPRLVRLNPNVPWKTRGNAAICLAFGKGHGRKVSVGAIDGKIVPCYPNGSPADSDALMSAARAVVERNAHFSCDKTNPGIVISPSRPRRSLYSQATREIVPLETATKAVREAGGRFKKYKNGRGVIGAAAAMAWRPLDRTYELLTYRKPRLVGSNRRISYESVSRMNKAFPSTFHNIDSDTEHIAIAPGSPCPVLFGIRGDAPLDLLKAKDFIGPERPDRWLLFLTNQATDDHLRRMRVRDLEPRQGAIIRGEVGTAPATIVGGHVFFTIMDGTGEIQCAVYEPSGSLRRTARELRVGDLIELYGSIRPAPFEINVEKMKVIELAQTTVKVENPMCPECGKHMKSIGKNAGYRCRKCGTKACSDSAIMRARGRDIIGWHEPPIASRRHLYKPIRRIGIKRIPLRELLNMLPNDESRTT